MTLYTKFDPISPPPPLMTNEPDSFAFKTMTTRIPGIARQVLADQATVYPSHIKQRIQVVHDDLVEDRPLTPLETPAPDRSDWRQAWRLYQDRRWLNTPWYFAEAFFYRKLIEATGYFDNGPEAGLDPFLPRKQEELQSEAAWGVLNSALSQSETDTLASLRALIHFCVWGNRVDLSYTEVSQDRANEITVEQEQSNLLVDDTDTVVAYLQQLKNEQRPHHHRVDFICDNAGTELLTDLALVDFLLRFGWVDRITLHVKAHPTYVSDATPTDIELTLAALRTRQQTNFSALANRLASYRHSQTLQIQSDFFWSSSHFYWEIPASLHENFSGAHLVFVKGDANYRRLLGDSRWPTTVPAGAAIPYFPAPFVALRTLKSDPIVGLSPGLAIQLDQEDPEWRVNGRRGIIQAVL